MQKDQKEQLVRCIEMMQKDVAEFEAKYQGRFAEEPHVGLGNRKTRCVNEATLPIITCHPSCLEKCAGTCYVINICTKPRPNCRRVEARNTVLRRIDPSAYYEHFYREAERLHLPSGRRRRKSRFGIAGIAQSMDAAGAVQATSAST